VPTFRRRRSLVSGSRSPSRGRPWPHRSLVFVLTDVEDRKRALSRRRYLVNATPCAGIERCSSTHRLPNSKSIRKETSKDEATIIVIMRCGIIMRCRQDRNFRLCLYPVLPPCVFSIKYNGFNDIRSRRQQPLSAWRLPLNRNDRGSLCSPSALRRHDFRVWPLLCRDIDLSKLKIPSGCLFDCFRRSG